MKDPARRLHDIADARIEIDEALEDPAAGDGAPAEPSANRLRTILPWAVALIAVVAAAWIGIVGTGSGTGGPVSRVAARSLQLSRPHERYRTRARNQSGH